MKNVPRSVRETFFLMRATLRRTVVTIYTTCFKSLQKLRILNTQRINPISSERKLHTAVVHRAVYYAICLNIFYNMQLTYSMQHSPS